MTGQYEGSEQGLTTFNYTLSLITLRSAQCILNPSSKRGPITNEVHI